MRLVKSLLHPICAPEKFDAIESALENPILFPYVINDLESLLGRLSELTLSPSQLTSVRNLLEDELIEAKLICQDARCDPFQYSISRRLDRSK